MNFPENLKYSQDHEWLRLEGDHAYIGITEFAQRELGDIVYVDINTLGQSVSANEIFGSVEAVKTVSDLFLPVSGEIVEINESLNDNPEAVNSDPYGEGWMVKIKLSDTSELDALMDSAAYEAHVG